MTTKDEQTKPWAWIKAANDILTKEPWAPANNGTMPVQLLPWLWLSDQRNAENARLMLENGITHVLSTNAMSKHSLNRVALRLKRVGIHHRSAHAHDQEGYDMIGNHWEECLRVLREVREAGGRLVVHCVAGTNRSGLIACAAMMVLEQERPLLEVVRNAKRIRGMLLTNESFQHQLCDLADRENLLGEKPEGYTDNPVEECKAFFQEPREALDKLAF